MKKRKKPKTHAAPKALGLIDRVRDVLDEDFYQDGLYEEHPADGIRWPLYTARQRAAKKLKVLNELMTS